MKKLLLFALAFGIGFSAFSQVKKHELKSTKAPNTELLMEKAPQMSAKATVENIEARTTIQDTYKGRSVSFIPMGQSGNAYGLYGNPRTYLWADANLNSVVFTHRMTGGTELLGNSRIAYDLSTDGGESFTTNIHVYTPLPGAGEYPVAGGRYPQGGIVNPAGNTDPANAYYTYFVAALDQTNGGSWGGYGMGSNVLTETDPANPTQTNLTTENGFFRLIPDAFTVTQQGVAWYLEPSMEETGGSYVYTGELIIGTGNVEDGAVVYEEYLYEFMDAEIGINDSKIAFAPDGQTGYILVMTDAGDISYTSYHPVLLKTTDGGATWSDPIHVQLGGVDGIESLKYYWSDEILESIEDYGPGFNRDEVYYNLGFTADIIVDGQGNPHITGIIAIGSEDGWYPNEGTMATWHVYSPDGGTTWDATALYDNIFNTGDIGDITQGNRPYAASTMDGHYLFFSWLDSDLEGAEGNTNPNIFVVGYDSEDGIYTEVDNVTYMSASWFQAFWGSMSQYVFAELDEGAEMWDCELPFMFTSFTVPGDEAAEMEFTYIEGYTMDMAVGINDNIAAADFGVSQNHPNPATENTKILVTSENAGVINLSINNILGQVVYQESVNNSALAYQFEINTSNFDSGIYFYTVKIGNSSVTKKMLVK